MLRRTRSHILILETALKTYGKRLVILHMVYVTQGVSYRGGGHHVVFFSSRRDFRARLPLQYHALPIAFKGYIACY